MGIFKKKPKPVELKSHKAFRKRKIMGVILIILAFAIAFIVIPALNNVKAETKTVVIAKTFIPKGNEITKEMVELDERGILGVDEYLIKEKDVIGKRASVDIVKNDLVTSLKVGKQNMSKMQQISAEKKGLTTITVKSNAAGLASHLLPGDIVQVYSVTEDEFTTTQIVTQNSLLKKIEIYDIENSTTQSVNKNQKMAAGTNEMVASTVTFITESKEQEVALIEAEYNGVIHISFVGR